MNIAAKYDEIAKEGGGRKMEQSYWPTVKKVVTQIPIDDTTFVLDIGTGNGYVARYFASEGARVAAIDVSTEMINVADQETNYDRISYMVGDMNSLPINKGNVDIAFSMGVFPYAEDLSAPLTEVYRVLSPQGRFYCCVNYYKEPVEIQRAEGQKGPGMNLRSKADYREAFVSAGFKNVNQTHIPNTTTEIPPEEEFPTAGWETKKDMRRSLREFGTLLTVVRI